MLGHFGIAGSRETKEQPNVTNGFQRIFSDRRIDTGSGASHHQRGAME